MTSPPPQATVAWTPEMTQRFAARYREAVSEKRLVFVFEGNEYVTAYAKYLLEYLVGVFELDTR